MIEVEHLTKYYGDHLAVDDLSFEIPDGHVYGFLGPNGAGKSTTMNIMTGCLSATEGHVRIGGHDIFDEPQAAKKLIGYLPEQPPLYMNETPVDYLKFVGKAKGLRGAELSAQIEKVLEETGITHMKNRRIATLSKGYKQRVGIAQALLGDPEVIILDEPTVGLDPLQIIEIRELIRSLGETHTVIFSSHILSEVQAICDEIVMIAKGRLVAYDTPENLERTLVGANEVTVTTDADKNAVRELISALKGVTELQLRENSEGYVQAIVNTDLEDIYELSRAIFEAFASNGIALLEMNVRRGNLEDIFIELADGAAGTAKKSSAVFALKNGGDADAALPDEAEAEAANTAGAEAVTEAEGTAASGDAEGSEPEDEKGGIQ